MVHGIKTNAINLDSDHKDTVKEWESENQERGIKIEQITTLGKKGKHRPTPHSSLVIFTESKEAANKCINLGFIISSTRHKVERYAPELHINQCYNCHGYGHRATFCKKKPKCGHCREESHATAECKVPPDEHCCINCKGNHQAWHIKCPSRTEEGTRLAAKRAKTSNTYP